MTDRTFNTGVTDADAAAKGFTTVGSEKYGSKDTSTDFANKAMASKLNLTHPQSVITIIIKDHEKIRLLYANFKHCAITDVQERENLAAALTRELAMHSFLEENVLYPQYAVMLGQARGKAAEKHSLDEHKKLKDLLFAMDEQFDVRRPSFELQLDEVMRVFNHHSHEEESDFLVELQDRTPPDKLIEWGKDFEAKRKIAPTRPHPSASSNTAAAAMSKPIDAIRDAASGRSEMAERAAKKA